MMLVYNSDMDKHPKFRTIGSVYGTMTALPYNAVSYEKFILDLF